MASRSRFGRSEPAGNALVVFAVVITVNGAPDSAVSSTPSFQPPSVVLHNAIAAAAAEARRAA